MATEKRRAFDGKFKERTVALAKERQNVVQAARELQISGSLLRTWRKIRLDRNDEGRSLN